jgi:hypothetical protein
MDREWLCRSDEDRRNDLPWPANRAIASWWRDEKMNQRIVALLIMVSSSMILNCQEKISAFHGTLPGALLFVDQTFHTSVLGELVDPVPSNISIHIDPESTAHSALVEIVRQCPGYELVSSKEAYLVVQNELFHDSANPMNQRIGSYQVPGDLAEFKLGFPNAVSAAVLGTSEGGALLSGLSLPKELSPSLNIELLRNVSARDILRHVAGEVGNLYSVLIFPNPHPAKERRQNKSFVGWEIAGGTGIAKYSARLTYYPHTNSPE